MIRKLAMSMATISDGNTVNVIDDTILKDALDVKVTVPDLSNPLVAVTVWEGSLADLVAGLQTPLVERQVQVPGLDALGFTVSMPLDIGDPGPADDNQYQGLRTLVGFTVHVEQVANNP